MAPASGGPNVPLPGREGGALNVLDGLLGGPEALGGGGVAAVGVDSAAPPFLLTHFFKFSSKTNEFSSPSLALMGPDCWALGSLPLNQPPNQPFFSAPPLRSLPPFAAVC